MGGNLLRFNVSSGAESHTVGRAMMAFLTGCLGILLEATAMAAPLAINQGGTGNTFGLPSQYTVRQNTATGTTINKLVKYVYSYGPFSTKAQIASTTDPVVVGVCVAGCGATGNATIQTGGYADCIFDGTTTVGDFVQIATSTGNGGDCTDVGATAPTSGQVIGQVLTANSGTGTASSVQLSLTPSTANACVTCKCIPAGAVTCANASWSTICSCNLGPFTHDPGPGNTWIDIDQNVIDFTNGNPAATAIDFELTASCPTANNDPHGLPASQFAAGVEYPDNTMVGLLTYNSADPLYPNACTVSVKCESGAAVSSTFTINPPANDSNGVPVGTAMLIKGCVYDNR